MSDLRQSRVCGPLWLDPSERFSCQNEVRNMLGLDEQAEIQPVMDDVVCQMHWGGIFTCENFH